MKVSETHVSMDMPAKLAHAMDRAACNACVGLDPVLERLPAAIDRSTPTNAIRAFSLGVLEAVAPHVACLKMQSACYERYGPAGLAILDEVMAAADLLNLPVILDAKRGDIGISAAHYAAGVFDRGGAPDWVTVNAYLGTETLEPYLAYGGIFVLVRTSNPDAARLQGLRLDDGRSVAEAMADMVAELAATRRNEHGWSDVGAVVGATHPAEAESLRGRMPGVILLVPGIGAQGGKVADCGPLCGEDGYGAVLTASRSVIYPDAGSGSWMQAISEAAARFADETGRVAGLR